MTKLEFIKLAINNGFDGDRTNGWEWIDKNLSELDDIFQSDKYKEQNGMKYKCMPFLIGTDALTGVEQDVLGTVWFLNNQREHKIKKEQKIKKFNDEGFFKIDNDEKLHGKKVEFILDNSGELFGGIRKCEGKLFWNKIDKLLMVVKKRFRRSGWYVSFPDVYIKIL